MNKVIVNLPSLEKIKVVSLFSGCGGLDWGFRALGYDIIWANERSQDAAESYKRLIGDHVVCEDITKIIARVPKAQVLIGGPPCQSFSLVGKRQPDDPRGALVFSFRDVVKMNLPEVFVMENVPGLLASKIDAKKLIDHLQDEFKLLGYQTEAIKIMASDYGVPQKRKRVILIGWRDGSKKFNFISSAQFARSFGLRDDEMPISVTDAIGDLPQPREKGNLEPIEYVREKDSGFLRLIEPNPDKKLTLHSMPTMSSLDREFVKHIPPGGNYMSIPDEIATKRIKTFKSSGGRTTTYGRLHPDRPAYTINTYFNRPNVGANYHYVEERLITVREAMRLQSFPDSFEPYYSTQRSLHEQIGNAVPPLMSLAIASSIGNLF